MRATIADHVPSAGSGALNSVVDGGKLAAMSVAVTQGIRVEVASAYVAERSSPELDEYFFAYTVRISNLGATTVQLLTRHWIITDGEGQVQEVRGPGVVGEQPVLGPGESFQYTSACPLGTPHGSMCGSYEMLREDGVRFDAAIAPFDLRMPQSGSRLLN
jgi:ApaG protein